VQINREFARAETERCLGPHAVQFHNPRSGNAAFQRHPHRCRSLRLVNGDPQHALYYCNADAKLVTEPRLSHKRRLFNMFGRVLNFALLGDEALSDEVTMTTFSHRD
jgi:hypothetical protein